MSETKRLRRSTEGGYARGDETRLRIIQAAIELFGEHGFVAASTREIAARAGVNAPALQYYFENKEGVYRACAEHLADEVWEKFEPVVRHASETLEATSDIAPLIEAFVAIQNVMIDKALTTPSAPTLKLFFVREQGGQEPAIATEIFQNRVRGPLNRVAAALIGKISGTSPEDPVTILRLLALHGQFMSFHMAPRSVMTLLGWSKIDAEKIEVMKQTIFANTRALLQLWAVESEARKPKGKTSKTKAKAQAEASETPPPETPAERRRKR
jgi:AcrR family transcriptional regulator